MALPKKVQEIGAAAEQQAEEYGLRKTGHGKPAPAEPASDPAKAQPHQETTDPTDWKERFSRYKAATDQTIADLRQTLADTQATLTKIQGQYQDLHEKYMQIQSNPQQGQQGQQEQQDPGQTGAGAFNESDFKQWLASLPKNITDEYDESWLKDQYIIQTTARGREDQRAPNNLKQLEERLNAVTQRQEKTDAQIYEEDMDRAYPNDRWIEITQEPEWNAFCSKTVSPVDKRTFGQIVKQGHESHDARTVIWVLQQYEQHLSDLGGSGQQAGQEEDTTLNEQITPEGGAALDPAAELNAQAETYTVSQVNQFFTDVATTKKYTAEQASAIEESIKQAQAAGKIIQG